MDVTTTPKILESAHLEIFKTQCDKENMLHIENTLRGFQPEMQTEKIQRWHNLSVSGT